MDHIATKGRCASKITELTTRSGGHAGEGHAGGNDDVDEEDGGSRLGPPFLVIFNFQVGAARFSRFSIFQYHKIAWSLERLLVDKVVTGYTWLVDLERALLL